MSRMASVFAQKLPPNLLSEGLHELMVPGGHRQARAKIARPISRYRTLTECWRSGRSRRRRWGSRACRFGIRPEHDEREDRGQKKRSAQQREPTGRTRLVRRIVIGRRFSVVLGAVV